MLLSGEAGSGKTHLFCDVARHRIEEGLPTLVVLGQQLGRGEVWRQMMEPLVSRVRNPLDILAPWPFAR
jgi:hypothetical protein